MHTLLKIIIFQTSILITFSLMKGPFESALKNFFKNNNEIHASLSYTNRPSQSPLDHFKSKNSHPFWPSYTQAISKTDQTANFKLNYEKTF